VNAAFHPDQRDPHGGLKMSGYGKDMSMVRAGGLHRHRHVMMTSAERRHRRLRSGGVYKPPFLDLWAPGATCCHNTLPRDCKLGSDLNLLYALPMLERIAFTNFKSWPRQIWSAGPITGVFGTIHRARQV